MRTIGNREVRWAALREEIPKTSLDSHTSLAKLGRNHFKLIKLESCSLRLGKSYFEFENQGITPLQAIVTSVFPQDVDPRLACSQKPYHNQYNLVTHLLMSETVSRHAQASFPLHPFQILTLVWISFSFS